MRITRLVMAAAFVFIFSGLKAYIPENSEENSFETKIVAQMTEVTNLVNDGIKSVRQEVVSSTYANARGTGLSNNGLKEAEAGEEDVTSKEVLYYEPKEEVYEARDSMDEMLIWINMYNTTSADDVVTFKKLKGYVNDKSKALDRIINALKYEKDNKDSVLKFKQAIKKIDKDFARYEKRLTGKVVLIPGKPLPEPTKDRE
jgi:vacuolar-type H+-ATPase subunit I/STV1